jgi:hypothetical protein
MLTAKLSATIGPPWTRMQALRLGGVRAGDRTPDLYITIADERRPLLRADIYRHAEPEAFVFQEAIDWKDRVFVGYGERVYVIDPAKRIGYDMRLGTGFAYFGAFYATPDYLLVASGESLLRLAADGSVLWIAPHLGLDGVVVHSVESGIIHGAGEWDPPGGWRAFAVRLDSGEAVASL